MKKLIAVVAMIALAGCSKEQPQQQVYQQPAPVYQQPAPVVVQAAPAQVVVQERSGDGGATAMIAGAALGAMAANAMNNNDRRDRDYYDRPRQDNSTNVTHVTVNKTYVNNVPPPQPEKQVAPVEPPKPTTAAAAAPVPAKIPSYSVAGAITPTLKPNDKPILQAKTVSPAPTQLPTNFALQMKKAPAPTPTPAAPKKVDYGYKAPTASPSTSYKLGSTSSTTKK